MSETSETVDWMRAIMRELLYPGCEKACLVTAAKSLFDVLVAEKAILANRRLSLEVTLPG